MHTLVISSLILLSLVVIVAAVLYLVVYLWLRHLANKEEHYNPLDAIDQPTTRGNLFRGRFGIDDYHRYKEWKRRKRDNF